MAATRPFHFDFELTDIEGQPLALADFKGKVVIVDIWGTWCPPCRAEIPSFAALVEKYRDSGLAIVGLNRERIKDRAAARDAVRRFHKQNNMNYRCALANDETIRQVPNLKSLPTTLFFDRTGEVRVRLVGLHNFETLEAIVQRLLDEKPVGASAAR